jgi:anti-sigma factor RsiW
MLWQHGGLAYALVSDVNPAELSEVAAQFAAATAQPHAP